MNKYYFSILLLCSLSAHAQSPVDVSTSARANEVAINTQREEIQYKNIVKEGPMVSVVPGEIMNRPRFRGGPLV